MCVVRTTAGSSADVVEGGIESARTRGVPWEVPQSFLSNRLRPDAKWHLMHEPSTGGMS